MLTLNGILRATVILDDEIPALELEGLDSRGLVIETMRMPVPNLEPYKGQIGEMVAIPVRALPHTWEHGATTVALIYDSRT